MAQYIIIRVAIHFFRWWTVGSLMGNSFLLLRTTSYHWNNESCPIAGILIPRADTCPLKT